MIFAISPEATAQRGDRITTYQHPDTDSSIWVGDSSDLPPRPASMIHDETDALSEETRSRLSSRLRELSAECQFDIYIAAFTTRSTESDLDRVKRIANFWKRQNPVIVLLYTRGTSRGSFHFVQGNTGFINDLDIKNLWSAAEQAAREAHSAVPDHQLVEAEITAAAESLVDGVLKFRDVPEGASDDSQGLIYVLFVILLIPTAGFLLIRLVDRSAGNPHTTAAPSPALYFPPVKVAPSFGATLGGGSGADIHFGGHSHGETDATETAPRHEVPLEEKQIA